MGIIHIPPQRYKCSECGGENGREYRESAQPDRPGTWEGVRCPDCGHETRCYRKSLGELEMGSGVTYSLKQDFPRIF